MNDFQSFTTYVFSLVGDFWDLIASSWWVAVMIILIILHSFLSDGVAEQERERKFLNRRKK